AGDFSSFKKEGQNYYETYYFGARLTSKLFHFNWSEVYLGYLLGNYLQEDYKPMSYKESIFGVRQFLIGNLNLTLEFAQSLAERDDYSYDAKSIKINHFFTLPLEIDFSISDTFLLKGFIYEDALGGIKRKDQKNTLEISFSKGVPLGLNLNLRYQFIVNRSNLTKDRSILGYGDYEGNIVSFGLSKFF
ncbi:MAG: hypothetical protein ACPL4K_01025, partial [Candidatus Margulisiibacteriota bacterium]